MAAALQGVGLQKEMLDLRIRTGLVWPWLLALLGHVVCPADVDMDMDTVQLHFQDVVFYFDSFLSIRSLCLSNANVEINTYVIGRHVSGYPSSRRCCL